MAPQKIFFFFNVDGLHGRHEAFVYLTWAAGMGVRDCGRSPSREKMAAYTIPTGLLLVDEMPRNQMGKVNKKDLIKRFFPA